MEIKVYNTFQEFEFNYLIEIESIKDKPQLLRYIDRSLEEYENNDKIKDVLLANEIGFIEEDEFINDKELIEIKTNKHIAQSIYFLVLEFIKSEKTQREFIQRVEKDFNIRDIVLKEIISSYYEKFQLQHLKRIKFESLLESLDREHNLIKEYLQFEKFKLKNNYLSTTTQNEVFIDHSDTSTKEKLIILDKLGVLDYLNSQLRKPNTNLHLSEILSSIVGVTTEVLNTYINPLRNGNLYDKNNPYYNEGNEIGALKRMKDFKLKE
ncbi:hypothetical protein NMK71_10510 [Weeksellaceae bacterium KMM 9713]|uniref:Uncharacterized protein n=1 Tax=Profundicola chukchiensis TaxID=2961959 RepID=A0A9X4MZ42_9FLAO|nr:hypothetical protein [Profundicola chukchiensis]MDG4946848.1 hypothetical protein [Profundicola chukchiensis]